MAAFDRKPMRCRQCKRRFYLHIQPPDEDDDQDEETQPAGEHQESKVD
jgi:hypothetical protein